MSTQKTLLTFFVLVFSPLALAQIHMNVVGTRAPLLEMAVMNSLKMEVDLSQYREARIHLIASANRAPDHAVIFLFSKQYHRFDLASVNLDNNGNVTGFISDYKLQPGDRPRVDSSPHCPDESIEFVAFAPNDDNLEQSVTVDVANAAIAHNLKTVQLLKADATISNYLNYMSCPNVKGNFYDGDANPNEITTVDGTISADMIKSQLAGAFAYKVTNIWLACEAYNDPFLSTMIQSAQAQKYAAGINDLEVGPSDNAAACAMKAALDGNPMTAAFQSCYSQIDVATDQWGFSGGGSDQFGQ